MIPPMTSPDTPRTVALAGHEFAVKELTDAQALHLNRYLRIFRQDTVEFEARSEAVDRVFKILHTCFIDPEQFELLTELEEAGEVELKDLVAIARPQEASEATVVKRRGRPR